MGNLLKKYFANILNFPVIKHWKNKLWNKLIKTDLQRQLEGKEKIISETEKMRKEKHRQWNKKKKKKESNH